MITINMLLYDHFQR